MAQEKRVTEQEIDERTQELYGTFAGYGSSTKFKEPKPIPWLGIFCGDTLVDDNYSHEPNAKRWQVQVRPVRVPEGGQAFVRTTYYTPTTSMRSKLGEFVGGLRHVGIRFKQAGSGELIGQVAWFETRTLRFGKNTDGETIEARVHVPIGRATAEEIDEARSLPPLTDDRVDAQSKVVAAPFEYDEEHVRTLLEIFDGQTKLGAVRNAHEYNEVYGLEINSGHAAEKLIADGLLTFDGSKYHRVSE